MDPTFGEVNVEQVKFDVTKQLSSFTFEDDDDAEAFSEDELDARLDDLVKKKKDKKTRSSSRSSSLRANAGKKAAKTKKTDVNIFKLDLSSLAREQEMLTGDPAICRQCGALLNSLAIVKEMVRFFRGLTSDALGTVVVLTLRV